MFKSFKMKYLNTLLFLTMLTGNTIEVCCDHYESESFPDNYSVVQNQRKTMENFGHLFDDYNNDLHTKEIHYHNEENRYKRMTDDNIANSVVSDHGSSPPSQTGGLSGILGPIWNRLVTLITKLYWPRSTAELFEFIRESYPLPGGLQDPMDEYDFVIIGAGSAGCVLANRLSEDGKFTVLLLEAGGGESSFTDIPLMAAIFQLTDYVWGYRTEWQEGNCLAMDDQRCHWPRGRAVGGSSVINYMIYTRGNKLDWDRVEEAGNPGWSYEDVLPYFLKSENANLKGLENSTYHRKGGPLSVEYVRYQTPLLDAFLKSAEYLGNKILDYNQGDQYGFSRVQATTLKGRRHSASRAFLKPIKTRENLHILPHSRVTKIKINEVTKTANAVEYDRNRKKHIVKARKEVILSAGPINSPQLLMLSGIGPKDNLKEFNIPLIEDLPVGQNLYDHVSYLGLIFLINQTGISPIESSLLNRRNLDYWRNTGKGPLTLIGGVEALGYIKTSVSEEPTEYPDMEFIFIPGGITVDRSQSTRRGIKLSDEFFNEVYTDIVEKDCFTVVPMILHPKSKGYMKLKSKNPYHWPKLYYDYFSEPRDMATFVESIKYIIKMTETPPFQKYGAKLYDKHYPTCKQFEFGSDQYWECAVRSISSSLYHQISTCKMGPATDPEAVVNHELKVYGIDRLRVIDTSIIPKPLTAHTNAPAIMIGEKGADMIKEQWR